jgi:hypothetical protein
MEKDKIKKNLNGQRKKMLKNKKNLKKIIIPIHNELCLYA